MEDPFTVCDGYTLTEPAGNRMVAVVGVGVLEHWEDALPVSVVGTGTVYSFEDGWINVDELDELITALAVAEFGVGDNERDVTERVVFVRLSLTDSSPVAIPSTVIRGEEYERVIPETEVVHSIKKPTKPTIDENHHCSIARLHMTQLTSGVVLFPRVVRRVRFPPVNVVAAGVEQLK